MKPILPFGKYLLLERISVGGMAEVFKARAADDPSARLLAIKRILPSMAEDADFITMFIDEARISGQLNHPHVAQIYELSRVGDSHFIAMEYVWGKDVLQIQNRFRRLKSTMPFPMAGFVAAKMCEALDYAHKKRGADGQPLAIIHRDVSPQNVLISYQGEVKVIDFGIAKAASRSTKTQAGVLKGKFGYMSPEQVGGQPLDRRSDIFAIGTILYEMITADRLFVGESDFATLEKVRKVDVRAPLDAVPSCPPEIDRIIRKALTKNVEDRYQWASEMAQDLQAWLASLPRPFDERDLATWMQEHFGIEMKREAAALDEQQRAAESYLGDATAAPPIPTAAKVTLLGQRVNGMVTARPPLLPRTQEVRVEDIVEAEERERAEREGPVDLPGDSTMILSAVPDLAPEGSGSAALPEVDQGLLQEEVSSSNGRGAALAASPAHGHGHDHDHDQGPSAGELQSESTRILDPAAPPPMFAAAAPSRIDELPSQATAIFDASSMRAPPPRPAPVAPAPPPVPRFTQLDANPLTSRVDALRFSEPPPARRSTLGKDIALGVVFALVVVGGIQGYLLYHKHSRPLGTLVVTVSPPSAARLAVDGQEIGAIESGKAFTVKELAAGPHYIDVRAASGGSFSDTVTVVASDVSVVTAMIQAPADLRPMAPPRPAPPAPPAPPPPPRPTTVTAPVRPAAPTAAEPITEPRAPAPAPAAAPPAAAPVVAPAATPTAAPTAAAPVTGTVPSSGPATTQPAAPEAAGTPDKAATPAATPPAESDLPAAPAAPAAAAPAAGGKPARPGRPAAPARGHLAVTTEPSGADVSVNGRAAGASPVEVGDLPRKRPVRVSVRKKGYRPISRYVDFSREADHTLDLKLVPLHGTHRPAEPVAATTPAGAAEAEPGFLVANTQPWARVSVDGKDTGKSTPIAPLSRLPLRPGKHTITFTVDGKTYSYPIEVKSGEVTRLIKSLSSQP